MVPVANQANVVLPTRSADVQKCDVWFGYKNHVLQCVLKSAYLLCSLENYKFNVLMASLKMIRRKGGNVSYPTVEAVVNCFPLIAHVRCRVENFARVLYVTTACVRLYESSGHYRKVRYMDRCSKLFIRNIEYCSSNVMQDALQQPVIGKKGTTIVRKLMCSSVVEFSTEATTTTSHVQNSILFGEWSEHVQHMIASGACMKEMSSIFASLKNELRLWWKISDHLEKKLVLARETEKLYGSF